MAKQKTIQSANFKKDYVTALAVGLFFFMVICELFVAISIPVTINHTTLYAEAGTRQKMLSSFDNLRRECRKKTKNANYITNMEKQFILWDLDLLSSHLREYSSNMPMSEVESVMKDIQNYNTIMQPLIAENPVPYCHSAALDLSKIADKIKKQLDSRKEL